MNTPTAHLAHAVANVEGPLRRLRSSLSEDAWLQPFTADAQRKREDATDAFLFRFQQVCDQLLRKVLPRLARVKTSVLPGTPFRDLLDALEFAGAISSADWWEELNELRNDLVHEYAMAPVERLAALDRAWVVAQSIVTWFDTLKAEMT